MRSYGLGIATDSSEPYGARWLFHFGAYGDTHVLVTGCDPSLEDALEIAAGWLADNAPGHLMAHDSKDLEDLYREACEDHGVSWEQFQKGAADGDCDEITSDAEADLTYTESGFLTSHEWTVTENPDRATILELQRRHMYESVGSEVRVYRTGHDEYTPVMRGTVTRVRASDGGTTVRLHGGKFMYSGPNTAIWR